MDNEFDDIRPYEDHELAAVYEELLSDEAFCRVLSAVFPGVPLEAVAQKMRACHTKTEFQRAFCYPFLTDIMSRCTDGVTLDYDALRGDGRAFTYISNHRDIVLDSGFLSRLLLDLGLDTVEIAIGDNLLIYPWIKKLVRVNKSFIVLRGLSMRQMLEASTRMSRYMHYAIRHKHQSIWIAQREGRAKDSNDLTQDSLLKMMAMGGEGQPLDRLKELNLVPLSLSYEYDPCDYLKAEELQRRRDDPAFHKTEADDLLNMKTGIFGRKGRVHFCVAPCLNNELNSLDPDMPRSELFKQISALIDRHIHANYRIYAGNYVAHDLLTGTHEFADRYSAAEQATFESYLAERLNLITLPGKDEDFLRERLLAMYANPLTNHLNAIRQ